MSDLLNYKFHYHSLPYYFFGMENPSYLLSALVLTLLPVANWASQEGSTGMFDLFRFLKSSTQKNLILYYTYTIILCVDSIPKLHLHNMR